MDILFLHQNFPGQFQTLAPALVRRGHRVFALTSREGLPGVWRGVRILRYPWTPPEGQRTHRWTGALDTAVARGEAVFRAARTLRAKGIEPDLIVAHTGWGEALFTAEVWPHARLAAFSELWYLAEGGDLGFDPGFPVRDPAGEAPRIRMKNMVQALQIERADALFSATEWQASTYPAEIRAGMSVLHEGIDTARSRPDPAAVFAPEGGPRLTRADRVISFVNRNLEPFRGFHVFMRALPALLAAEPDAQVVLVGGTGVSYGRGPPGGGTWKDALLSEIGPALPSGARSRIHFTGLLPHAELTRLFQVTGAHVYLTYPFVAGWSLLEAMACGAPVVASDVAPVREFVTDGETGRLVGFFDGDGLVAAIRACLADPAEAGRMGAAARAHVLARYDLDGICLPRRIGFVEALACGRGRASERLVLNA